MTVQATIPSSKGGTAWRVTKKVLGVVVVIVGVTFISFLLSYLSPTDAATQYFSEMGYAPTANELAAKRAELGLDQPFIVQYGKWILGLLHGDLGTSLRNGTSVFESLMEALPYTLALTGAATLLSLVVSIPLGLLCAYRKDGAIDNILRAFTYVFYSMPGFFISLMLLYILAVKLHWFRVTATPDFSGMVMPTLALSIPLSGWYIRQIRTIALEQLGSGYTDGLRSRGLPERTILFKHVLRNSLVPIIALVGVSVGSLLGGSAIVESIFSWPGVGCLSVEAISGRDYAVVEGYALLMAIVYLVVNALVDLFSRIADPRISKEAR
ncbi:MAG: ABC transporter permease [Coriobacteriales bacterium]|jgi:ABC-type dipeptide/oligopeptide/nickel transport system permease component